MSRHEGVSCDHCKKNNIRGLRYKCLICINFDLCQDCQLSSAEPSNHSKDHPMQCVLTKNDADLYFGGELEGHQEAFTCPYCGRMGLSEEQLEEHVNRSHTEDELDRDVQCPICAVGGTEAGAREDFLGHLTISHRCPPLAGIVPGARRLRRGGGRGRRGESLVDLLAHLGATGQTRAPLRPTIHHSHPQPVPAAQVLSPSEAPPSSRKNNAFPNCLLSKKATRSESDLSQTEQNRSEKSLFARQLILSLLSRDTLEMDSPGRRGVLRNVLAEPLHEEGAGHEGHQIGGEGGSRCQDSGGKEESSGR